MIRKELTANARKKLNYIEKTLIGRGTTLDEYKSHIVSQLKETNQLYQGTWKEDMTLEERMIFWGYQQKLYREHWDEVLAYLPEADCIIGIEEYGKTYLIETLTGADYKSLSDEEIASVIRTYKRFMNKKGYNLVNKYVWWWDVYNMTQYVKEVYQTNSDVQKMFN